MSRSQVRDLRPIPVWLGRLSMELRRLASPLLATHGKGLLSITFDIPLPPLSAPSAGSRHWFYWQRPAREQVLLGLGQALIIETRGGQRFPWLRREWRQLQQNWTHINQGSANPRARAFVGFSFDPQAAGSGHWAGFPNAMLMVPELLLEWRGGRCMLTFSHLREQDEQSERVIGRWLVRLNGLLQDVFRAHNPVSGVLHARQERPEAELWRQQVAEAVTAMENGPMTKVVLARELLVSLGKRVDHRDLLYRLSQDYPACTLFGVRFDGAILVGATPERLLSIRRGRVVSDALAGTFEQGREGAVEEMVRHEHRPVVEAIVEALEPYCHELEAGCRPTSMQLRQLSHFYTRVQGRLKNEGDPFGLLEALHPTPAVGGLPRGKALDWIRKREGIERGWYTGGLGWLGGAGEAELSVILRCGLIEEKCIRLFAGAGITAISDPASEFAETELKMSALLERLSP